jgi:parvulin-like peptidyl-prolyl isomerase
MPILVNDQLVEDQTIRDEARVLKERLKLELPGEEGFALELRAREWARENVIQRVLLQQAAGSVSPEELLSGIMQKTARPKPKEIAAYYQQFKSLFHVPESIRAAHIVKNVDETASEEQAAAAIREIEIALRDGAKFGDLADRYSDCPGDGGDLGFFARGEMVDEFETAVCALQPGETSGVFRSPFGFHIAKLIERRPARLRPLNEVRGEIEEHLWSEKKQRAAADFIEGLRARAEIKKV